MKLSIITLNYKTADLTLSCISSVYSHYKNEFEKGEIEHIIVDNNSEDGSVEKLRATIKKETYKHVTVVANKENAGFGRGCNVGVSHAKGDYVLFLNSDTTVVDNSFLEMVQFMEEHPKIAIAGSKIVSLDGSIQLSAWKFYTLPNLFLLLLGLERFKLLSINTKEPSRVDWVSGACFMARKSDFIAVGEFDKNIFMYMEDMELCYRAKQKDFLTYYYPYASIIHSSHGSSNRTFAIMHIYQGILYFYKKHRPVWEYYIAKTLLKTKAIFLFIIGRITGNSYLTTTYGQALKIS